MSTTAAFEDEEEFLKSIASIRDDNSSDNYLLVGHVDGNPLKIKVINVGEDPAELGEQMVESECLYAIARYKSTFDMSTTVKFVYFKWLGDKVPFVKRGRYGVVHGSIQDRFNPYHLFLECTSVEQFEPEKIVQQLEENTGKFSKVLESTEGRQMRGFTANQLPNRGPRANVGPQVVDGGSVIEVTPAVKEAISMVRSDDDPMRWLLAEYRANDPCGPVDQVLSGNSDSDELVANFSDEKAMYGLYRVKEVVDDIVTVKFVYIIWVGNQVKPMTKAKISTHKGKMEETFGPFHVKLFASDRFDLSENLIMEKLNSASGAKSALK